MTCVPKWIYLGYEGATKPLAAIVSSEWIAHHGRSPSAMRAKREMAADGFARPEAIEARRAYYGGRCYICGIPDAKTMDHVIPLARGGSNWPANLRPACQSCNSRKGAR